MFCFLLFSGIDLAHNYMDVSVKNYFAFKKLKRMNSSTQFRELARLIVSLESVKIMVYKMVKRIKNNGK